MFLIYVLISEYGLKPLESPASDGLRIRKSTTVRSNVAEFADLSRACSGRHEHVCALGTGVFHGKSYSRAAAAGAYPAQLCRSWVLALNRAFERGARRV